MLKQTHTSCIAIASVLLVILTGGCQTLPERVREHVGNDEYREAYELLVDKGLNETPEEELDEEQIEAREFYKEAVVTSLRGQRSQSLPRGNARASLKSSQDFYSICPWSDQVESMLTEDQVRVETIDAYISESRMASPSSQSDQLLLRTYVDVTRYLNDSPAAQRDMKERSARHARFIIEKADEENWSGDELVQGITTLYTLTHVPSRSLDRVTNAIELETTLSESKPASIAIDTRRELGTFNSLESTNDWKKLSHSTHPDILTQSYIRSRLLDAIAQNSQELLLEQLDDERINVVEERYGLIRPLQSQIKSDLGQAHLEAAKLRSSGGVAALVALVHLERSRELIGYSPDWNDVNKTARYSFANAEFPNAKVFVEVPPSLDLNDQAWLYIVTKTQFNDAANPLIEWIPPDQDLPKSGSIIKIELTDVDIKRKDIAWQTRQSRYISHYESVPNPVKDSLDSQINYAKSSLGWALSSYESAVNSHNAYPTRYSLANANSKKSAYIMALNHHNSLVDRYNSTPDTVQRPVSLPYEFREGTVRHGIQVQGTVQILNATAESDQHSVSAASIQSDFTRKGTEPGDINVSYRRDDPIAINTTIEALAYHVDTAILEIIKESHGPLYDYEVPADLAKDLSTWESELITTRFHPLYGITSDNRVRNVAWAREIIHRVELPKPAERSITKTIDLGLEPDGHEFTDLEQVVPTYGAALIRTVSKSNSGWESGSGCVISPEGHILTCAHIINSRVLEVEFPYLEGSGSYKAEVVYSNQKDDVAVLKIANPPAGMKVLPVDLDMPLITGERIFAMGNPKIPPQGVRGVVTGGTVAKAATRSEDKYESRHKLDLTAASGSSGGPIIRMRDGRVVGVISFVLPPQAEDWYASSGYWAYAVPGDQLDELLLLRYR